MDDSQFWEQYADLVVEYRNYCEANKLPTIFSADELQYKLLVEDQENHNRLRRPHIEWLETFIKRWNAVPNGEVQS